MDAKRAGRLEAVWAAHHFTFCCRVACSSTASPSSCCGHVPTWRAVTLPSWYDMPRVKRDMVFKDAGKAPGGTGMRAWAVGGHASHSTSVASDSACAAPNAGLNSFVLFCLPRTVTVICLFIVSLSLDDGGAGGGRSQTRRAAARRLTLPACCTPRATPRLRGATERSTLYVRLGRGFAFCGRRLHGARKPHSALSLFLRCCAATLYLQQKAPCPMVEALCLLPSL